MTGMKHRYSNLLGVKPDTPIIVGASDGVLSNLGEQL